MPYVPSQKTDPPAGDRDILDEQARMAADSIAFVSKKYAYDGAFAGELNFFLTRLLNHLPRKLMEHCGFKEEMRYWFQPVFFGVFLDVVLEYKRRVNVAYEAAQIEKSGDCYDTPYYTKLVDVVNAKGENIGTIEVMLKRSPETINVDKLPFKVVLQ